MTRDLRFRAVLAGWLLLVVGATTASSQRIVNIFDALLGETGELTAEVSTQELRRILAEKSAVVFDVRPFREFAVSHIPGAVNVSARPDVPMSMYVSDVAEVGRALDAAMSSRVPVATPSQCRMHSQISHGCMKPSRTKI